MRRRPGEIVLPLRHAAQGQERERDAPLVSERPEERQALFVQGDGTVVVAPQLRHHPEVDQDQAVPRRSSRSRRSPRLSS
jgi:hypothetical protein